MLGALLVVALIVWVSIQTRESRQPVWRARFAALAPVFRHVAADIHAIHLELKWLRLRRKF